MVKKKYILIHIILKHIIHQEFHDSLCTEGSKLPTNMHILKMEIPRDGET